MPSAGSHHRRPPPSGRLVEAVLTTAADVSTDDLADAVWLLGQVVRPIVSGRPIISGKAENDQGATAGSGALAGSAPPARSGTTEEPDAPDRSSSPTNSGLLTPPADEGRSFTAPRGSDDDPGSPGGPSEGLQAGWRLPARGRLVQPPTWIPLRSPAADPLPRTLSLARALRPLCRRTTSRAAVEMDEDATARRVVEEGIWSPAFRPSRERWLRLALIVDVSISMSVWRREVKELHLLTERLGAFRDVRVWQFDGDQTGNDGLDAERNGPPWPAERLTLRTGSARWTDEHDAHELVDPTQPHVLLVVSDCVGAAWGNGLVNEAMRTWGQGGTLAVIHMLPQRLWPACAPETTTVSLYSPRRLAANAELRVSATPKPTAVDTAGWDTPPSPSEDPLPVPVLELQPRWLGRWATLLAAGGSLPRAAVLLLAGEAGAAPARHLDSTTCAEPDSCFPTITDSTPDENDPDLALARFREFASTEALHLAACLAAAPLTLPVMRLVQQAVLPRSRSSALAEVFLGGLLRRVPLQPWDDPDPEARRYDFVPGVRSRLLDGLRSRDKLDVLTVVSDFIASRIGSPNDFRAYLSAEGLLDDVLTADPPFGRVALRVLRSLGGRYEDAARKIERQLQELNTRRAQVDQDTLESASSEPGGELAFAPGGSRAYRADLVGDSMATLESPVERTPRDSPESASVEAPPVIPQPSGPSVFGGVPFRNPHFTGRLDLLGRLHSSLRQGSRQLTLVPYTVHGLGGVGKTQLALEYAWRYASDYELVWWIRAESLTTARSDLADLAERLGLPSSPDTTKTVSNVLEALRRGEPYRRWLLVFDNAQSPEELRNVLPVPTGHVLITSRNPEWSEVGSLLEVDVFTREESVALLQRRGTGIPEPAAHQLADMLGDLPLALDQAAVWQSATGTPVEELTRLLKERMHQLLADGSSTAYPVSVLATWDLAFSELRQKSPSAARLLEMLAFFGADPIPMSVLRDGRHAELPPDLLAVLRDDLLLRRAIRQLGRYALAKVTPEPERIEVHRLIQAVLREELTDEQRNTMRDAVHRILGAANPGSPDERRTWARHAELQAHITPSGVIMGHSEPGHRAVLDQIRYRYARSDYERSLELARKAREVWCESLGPDHEFTLLAQFHLALAHRDLGHYAEAAELNRDTLERMRATFGENHEHTLATLTRAGRDLRLQAEFTRARELDEDTLARHQRVIGDDDAETLRVMNNLGVDLRMMGDGAAALDWDQRTYELRTQVSGPDHTSTLFSLVNLGRDLADSARYPEALQRLSDALERATHRLGPSHRCTLMARRNLAIVTRRSGDARRARQLSEELYQQVENLFPLQHEVVLMALTTYANAMREVNQAAVARELAERALHGYRETFGNDHVFTHVAAVNLAVALRSIGENHRALELDEMSLRALSAKLGEKHPHVLVATLNLATDQAVDNNHQRARELSHSAYQRSIDVRGADHPETLACGLNYARDLRATGDLEASATLVDEISLLLQNRYGSEHPVTRAATEGHRADADIEYWDT